GARRPAAGRGPGGPRGKRCPWDWPASRPSRPGVLVDRLLQLVLELLLEDAVQVAGAGDLGDRPVFADPGERLDVECLARVAVADEDGDRDLDPPDGVLRQGQLADAAEAGRRRAEPVPPGNLVPELLERAPVAEPAHAAQGAGPDA